MNVLTRDVKLSERDETRTRLLEGAIVEFAEHGFDHATVRDICARAGVNLNAVKYYYEDKQGLFVAAVRHAHAVCGHAEQEQPAENLPPTEQLVAFIGGMLAMALSDQRDSVSHQLLMMREMVNPTAATNEIVQSFIKPRFTHLNAILAQLLPPETPQLDRHLLALSVVGQCLHYKIGRKIDQILIAPSEYRRFTLPRLTEHISQVILAAIDAHWKKLGLERPETVPSAGDH